MEERTLVKYAVIIPLFAALIVYTFALRYRAPEAPPAPDLDSLPRAAGDYAGVDESLDARNLEVLGSDKALFRTYRRGAESESWLFIGYFGSQQENSQIHSPKHCYPGSGWNILEEGRTQIPIDGAGLAAKHLVISDGVETLFIIYWFASANGTLTNEFALKWNQMKNSLLGRPQETAFVRFSTLLPGGEGDPGAKNELAALAGLLAPHIERMLGSRGAAPPGQERIQ